MEANYITIATAEWHEQCLIFGKNQSFRIGENPWTIITPICPWRHKIFAMMTSSMEHFPRYWLFVRGIHRSPVNSPHKGQWRGALMFSLICIWINDWVNNREAGDLRRYRGHYDVTVMRLACVVLWFGGVRRLKIKNNNTRKGLCRNNQWQLFTAHKKSVWCLKCIKANSNISNIIDTLGRNILILTKLSSLTAPNVVKNVENFRCRQ